MSSKLSTYFSCLILAFLFSSCRELTDHLDKAHPKKECKLASILFTPDSSATGGVAFSGKRLWNFNEAGEPISSIVPMTSTGNSNLLFTYDAKGNLNYYVSYYRDGIPVPPFSSNNNIAVYHAYSSDLKGNIVTDTVYSRIPLKVYRISTYNYDNKNRMIACKATDFQPGDTSFHFSTITTFSYNAQGNLDGKEYDNLVSFKSKSKVLQFLTRDYSANNLLTDELNRPISYSYNNNYLPATSSGGNVFTAGLNQTIDWGKNTFTYQCK